MESHALVAVFHFNEAFLFRKNMVCSGEKRPRLDFGSGSPSPDLIASDVLEKCSEMFFSALRSGDYSIRGGKRHPLAYGKPLGNVDTAIEPLADFLSYVYGREVKPGRLMLTAGCSHGLDLACRQLGRPGDVAFVEDPTYFKAIATMSETGLELRSVETDEGGLDPVSLLKGILAAKEEGKRPRFIYTVPTFSNPLGRTLSPSRRREIVRICSAHDMLVVSDDPYSLLHFCDEESKAEDPFSESSRVVSLGSFSKLLAPGLRLGWIEADQLIVHKLLSGVLSSGGCISQFSSQIVSQGIRGGLILNHLDHVRKCLARRSRLLFDALIAHCGEAASFSLPQGGYFIWVTLQNSMRAETLLSRLETNTCYDATVSFRCGNMFSLSDAHPSSFRLCYAKLEEDDIVIGGEIIGKEIARMFA